MAIIASVINVLAGLVAGFGMAQLVAGVLRGAGKTANDAVGDGRIRGDITGTIDYAEGYLFDYGAGQAGQDLASGSGAGHGYNAGDWREKFFMQHFGYRMRTNKLTAPDANVITENE